MLSGPLSKVGGKKVRLGRGKYKSFNKSHGELQRWNDPLELACLGPYATTSTHSLHQVWPQSDLDKRVFITQGQFLEKADS